MKNSRNIRLIGILISVLMLQGCLSIFSGSKFKVERDRVLGTTRIRVNMEFKKAVERGTSLVKLQKSITKEKDLNMAVTYRVFDVVDLERASFGLRNEMAIIVDNIPYVIFPEIFETTLIGDPNQGVPIGTSGQLQGGFFEHRTFRLNYILEEPIIEIIKNSTQIFFRYYAGPDIISVKLTRSDIRNFKRMIDQDI